MNSICKKINIRIKYKKYTKNYNCKINIRFIIFKCIITNIFKTFFFSIHQINLYFLNPFYYYTPESNNKLIQSWLDQKIFAKPQKLGITNILFPLENGVYYQNYWTETPIITNRDLLLNIYEFYFKCEIDGDFTSENNLSIHSGYWFFFLDISGWMLEGYEIIDDNSIKIYTTLF